MKAFLIAGIPETSCFCFLACVHRDCELKSFKPCTVSLPTVLPIAKNCIAKSFYKCLLWTILSKHFLLISIFAPLFGTFFFLLIDFVFASDIMSSFWALVGSFEFTFGSCSILEISFENFCFLLVFDCFLWSDGIYISLLNRFTVADEYPSYLAISFWVNFKFVVFISLNLAIKSSLYSLNIRLELRLPVLALRISVFHLDI